MISHNMADVMRVADEVCVMRLGRNNGVFNVAETSPEEVVGAITGAVNHPNPTDHAPTEESS